MLLAFEGGHSCVRCQRSEELVSSSSHFYEQIYTKELVNILIPTRRSPHTQNNKEHNYTPANDNRHIPYEKRMTIDVLNIISSSLEADISNSSCDGNGCHGCVANAYITFV